MPPTRETGPMGHSAPLCVAIPVRDEQDEIAGCLDAVSRGLEGLGRTGVVVLANNCLDATAARARRWARDRAPGSCHVESIETELPPERAHAGGARALAMRHARRRVGSGGIILTTDGDSRPGATWAADMVQALARCDMAFGPLAPRPGPGEEILRIYDRLEQEALSLQSRYLHRVSAEKGASAPAHQQESGASLGVTAAAWDRLGGLPELPCGEDRAFAMRAIAAGLRVERAAVAPVMTSWRLAGRARGGHADTLARRLSEPDPYCDERILPLDGLLQRAKRLGGAGQGRAAFSREGGTTSAAPGDADLHASETPQASALRMSEVRAMLPTLRRLAHAQGALPRGREAS